MGRIIILKSVLNFLRYSGVWPRENHELDRDMLYFLKLTLMTISISPLLICTLLHLIVSLIYEKDASITEDLVIIIAEVGVIYFNNIFAFYQKDIAKIYLDLSDFRQFGRPHHYIEANKRLLTVSKAYINLINVLLVGFTGLPLIKIKECEEMNLTKRLKDVCGLMAPAWMPFNIDYFPMKQIFYLVQCYSSIVTLKTAALISLAIAVTMEYLVIRIQHLKILLKEIVDDEDQCSRQRKLAKWVQYHLHIFDIGSRIDRCYTGCLLLHVLLSGALFGCIGYTLKEKASLNGICLFIGWFSSLIVVCISGQHLIDETMSVGDAAYNTPWYKADTEFQKNIVLVIKRAQKPILIHAGPFSYISHIIIVTILKTAYSYLTLLNATSK